MHSMLPSSLARFSQPSRAKLKNGLLIALGTITNLWGWESPGAVIIAMAMQARRSFLIASLHTFCAYPFEICGSRRRIDNTFVVLQEELFKPCASGFDRPALPG